MTDRFEQDGIVLICGDCRPHVPLCIGECDVIITDPPYGIGEAAKNHKSRNRVRGGVPIISPDYERSDWDDKPCDAELLRLVLLSSEKAIIWGGNYFPLPPQSKWLVWDKLNSGDFADCELAWTNLGGAVRKFAHMWNGMMRDSERGEQRIHPTQKPVALFSWCIEQADIAPNSLIFDPFFGSCSGAIAAVRAGHRFLGFESQRSIFEKAVDHVKRELAQPMLIPFAEPKLKTPELSFAL